MTAASNGRDEADLSAILHERLFLSGRSVASNAALLQRHRIAHVLSVTKRKMAEVPGVRYKALRLDDVEVEDLSTAFVEASTFIEESLGGEGACLVHCDVGVSRSPSLVIAYLMRSRRMRLLEAFQLVRSARPVILPNFGFVRQLMAFDKMLFPRGDQAAFEVYVTRLVLLTLSSNSKKAHSASKSQSSPISDGEIVKALDANGRDIGKAVAAITTKAASSERFFLTANPNK